MLNRRRKIQKYISALKKKHLKKFGLNNHQILKHKVQVKNEPPRGLPQVSATHGPGLPLQIEYDQQEQHQEVEQLKPCWKDSDDERNEKEKIKLNGKNKFAKLKLKLGQGNNEEIEADEYERKLGKFYQSRYQRFNWAKQENNVIEEKDINDYMNEDVYFSDKKQSKKTIKFQAKTVEHHESIISGIDWHKNIVFTCGLDHKLKIWHFLPEQKNPDLKLKQEKDIFVADLPLSNCYFKDGKVIAGTLRKNIVLVDTEKWKPTFLTSSFLKQHKTYQNLKISVQTNQTSIYSQNRISLLDKNSIYCGSLLANQNVEDVCFGSSNSPHSIYAVSSDTFYQWDSRKLEIIRLEKKYLNFTSITTTPTSINIGSKLGSIYIYSTDFANPLENNNLVTDITQVSSNKDGTLTLGLSKWKSNAVRVIDSLTGRAIGDWPSAKTKIGLPMRGSFNQGNYFGVGNSHGYLSIYGFESQIL